MRLTQVIIIFTVLTAVAPNAAVGSTTSGDRQHADVRMLKKMADLYFAETGHYPMTDAAGTWFQKLVAARYTNPVYLMCDNPSDAALPVDFFGQPLVYEVPTPTSPGSAIVRCIGKDGIDNHGAGDDLDSRYGPNLGYWNKARWPEFARSVGGGWLLALLAGLSVRIMSRSRLFSAAVFLLTGGVIVGIAVSSYFRAGFFETSASRWPGWGESVCAWSFLCVLAGLAILLYATVRRFGRRTRRLERGLCPACAYPIGTSRVCTECGDPLPSNW